MLTRPDRAEKWLAFVVAAFVVCVLFVGAAIGSGGEVQGADRSGDLKDLLYRFINFALLVIILFVILKKVGIKQFFVSRSEAIRIKLEELKNAKEEAERKYRELEQKIKEWETNRNSLIEQFKAEGLAEKERILAEARERAKQIVDQAEASIQQEMRAASERLKAEVVTLAAQRAEAIIAGQITEKDQDNLVNDFIERVGKGH
jgi:F-type H+-transporting ATPase subunit b